MNNDTSKVLGTTKRAIDNHSQNVNTSHHYHESNHTTEAHTDKDSSEVLEKILIGVLMVTLLVGIVGNILNLVVFGKRRLRNLSTFRFLMYLSASDLLVLLIATPDVLIKELFNFEIRLYSLYTCKFHTFLTYFFTHASNFILMAICIDRSIAICGKTQMRNQPAVSNNANRSNTNSNSNSNERPGIIDVLKDMNARRRPQKSKSLVFKFNATSKFVIEVNNFKEIKEDLKNLNSTKALGMFSDIEMKRLLSISFLNKHSVDIIIVTIALALCVLNFHHVAFLNIYGDVDHYQLFRNETLLTSGNMTDLASIAMFEDEDHTKEIEQNQRCFASHGSLYEQFMRTSWFWFDLSAYSLIPALTMSVCSAIIIVRMRKINRSFRTLLDDKNYQYNHKNYLKKIRKNRQIMLMLLNSNLYFLFTMLQLWVFVYLFKGGNRSQYNTYNHIVELYLHVLAYSNNALDFLFYSLTSEKYRDELVSLFKPLRTNSRLVLNEFSTQERDSKERKHLTK